MANHKMQKKKSTPICVPKCCQQPRSHTSSKPRTDFSSLFFSTHSSCCNRGSSSLDLLSNKNNLSSVTTSNMDRHCQALTYRHEETQEFPLVKCSMLQNGGKGGIASDSSEIASSESESHHKELQDVCNNRINVQSKCSDATVYFCSPNKSTSQLTECSDVQATPGTIMWARTAHQMWWPAKIVDKMSAAANTDDDNPDGHVLIQYYGNHDQAWVDPAGDLSEFDECFEERSCNPMEAFQDALKQALHKEDLDSSPEKSRSKWSGSSSSREEDDYVERGRGKRKRKPKIHFDEVTTCSRSATKKMRRLRIMRFLGLTPPVGSPFSLAASVRNF
ncbi:hypothetical protein ACHQM5_020395 [Ranunculus cassubicifolius]